jgi:hypothetical protein
MKCEGRLYLAALELAWPLDGWLPLGTPMMQLDQANSGPMRELRRKEEIKR